MSDKELAAKWRELESACSRAISALPAKGYYQRVAELAGIAELANMRAGEIDRKPLRGRVDQAGTGSVRKGRLQRD